MSTNRVNPKAGWARKRDLRYSPDGRVLCRRCSQPVPKGRMTFCSQACVHEWKVRSDPGYVRRCLLRRDAGVCCVCGCDTAKLRRILWYAYHAPWTPRLRLTFDQLAEVLAELGIPSARWYARGKWGTAGFWDADHVVPVVEGGGECGLDEYRTLCIPCHKHETAELRKRMAAARRQEGQTRDGNDS